MIPFLIFRITKGHYVYEFRKRQENDGPGFLTKKSPDGFCLPCCFKKWDSKNQIEQNGKCNTETSTPYNDDNNKNKNNNKYDNKYVYSYQVNPIDQYRWGFLPISVQNILNTNQQHSQSQKNPSYILPNKSCLLRYGVEKSITQSFIACIAEIYSSKRNQPLKTIKEIKKIITNAITIDLFIKYQNGSLVTTFRNEKEFDKTLLNSNKYNESIFLKSLDKTNEIQMKFLINIISSYERFIQYINDDTIIIDHKYLWDAISDKNNLLIKDGLNLIVLEILNNDITENISLICPTNTNKINYDPEKQTTILLKNGHYYQPIYQYLEKNNSLNQKNREKLKKKYLIL